MNDVAALAFGYLLGSFLPAYFLGRERGVDLRFVGTRNPGATNAYHVLGPWAGAVALAVDGSKGLIAMALASAIRVPALVVYGAGLMTIVGHRFPFYLRFKGGQGVGTSAGMLLFAIVVALLQGRVASNALVGLAVVALAAFVLFRSGAVVALCVLPPLFLLFLFGGLDLLLFAFAAVVLAHIWIVDLDLVRANHLIASGPGWRVLRRALSDRSQR